MSAVFLDYIGTITELVGYSLEKAEAKMFRNLVAAYDVDLKALQDAYRKSHEKYHEIRYRDLVEVTNAVWVADALNNLGCPTTPQAEKVGAAVNTFFKDYLYALRLRPTAKTALQKLSSKYNLGLITNFTFAPLIYASLRRLDISKFFNAVLVSHTVGWRKPSPKIFHEALKKLKTEPAQAIFVGDTPLEDIEGARNVGMKTVFIPSQFNTLEDMNKTAQPPDYHIRKLTGLLEILKKI